MDERAFYTELTTTRQLQLNCPYCRTTSTFDLRWIVRRKKERLPPQADERDRARFSKAQSYMVLIDEKVACTNLRCRKRFDVSGIKTMAFLSPEQEAALPKPERSEVRERPRFDRQRDRRRPGGQPDRPWRGDRPGRR